jgi:hypothetical protein
MDFYPAIRELHEEMKRLDRLIAALEAIENGENPEKMARGNRRGRKAMSEAERQLVSKRMKRYWAGRRNGFHGSPKPDGGLSS